MDHQIKHRHTNAVLYEGAAGMTVRETLEKATAAKVNLAGAYLADANLAGANLAGAKLAGANLAGANLADANLADANLAGANLTGANLADANLTGAYLAGAYLAGANLADANLADAKLADANLTGAKWRGVVISKPPIQLFGLHWRVTILDAHMQIGCEFHSISDWAGFDDARITKMDGRNALRFWRSYKAVLLGLADAAGRGAAVAVETADAEEEPA